MQDSPAWFYNRILVGSGDMLRPDFVKKHNITHVINCAHPADSPAWFRTAFPDKYTCIDAQDTLNVYILYWFPHFEKTLRAFLRDGTGNVFVHCQAGVNRSGFLALAYVCKNFHLPLEEVFYNARKQRPILFQNPTFMRQVRDFINNGCVSDS
jgi:protein tyrosine phosphatase